MKLLFVVIILIIPYCAQASLCVPECRIGSGIGPDSCQYYIDNDAWLPPKYAYATHCVCSNPSLTSPPLNCVRKQLQILHDSWFSDSFKQVAANMQEKFISGAISEGEYNAWTDSQFGQKVKSIHDQAFKNCCCTGTPANSYWWHGIFVWNSFPCFAIREGQELLSDCGCDGQA